MADAAARYQTLDGQGNVAWNLVYNPSSGNWELEQQAVIEAVTGNLYVALDELLVAPIYARWGSGDGETDEVRINPSTNALNVIDTSHHEVHDGSKYYFEGHTTLATAGNYYLRVVTPDTTKWGHLTWQITGNGITSITLYEGSSGGMAGGASAIIHANNRNKTCWSGLHTGGNNEATVLTDSSQAWTIDALIGLQVYNQTDGSCAFITDNDATTVTVAELAGGTGNDWDTNDVYEINNSQMVGTVGMNVPTVLGLILADTSFGGSGFKADVGGGTSREDEIIKRRNETYVFHILSGSDDNIITYHVDWYEHADKH